MRTILPVLPFLIVMSCAMPDSGPEPSLAPRPAETIDPRVPISGSETTGPVDPALAQRLAQLVATARAGVPAFEAREAEAARLVAKAGPISSENWVAAQQALSRLIEQYGVTTRAAADIDELASTRLKQSKGMTSGNREAIAAAASAVAAISEPQAAAVARLNGQLER